MNSNRSLIVHSPTVSKAVLMDLLGGLALQDPRVKVREENPDSSLASDPATVALITTVGVTVAELIKAAVSIYLERRKAKAADPPKPARVTVYLTLGGKRAATVTAPEQLDESLKGVSDYAEVARIEIA